MKGEENHTMQQAEAGETDLGLMLHAFTIKYDAKRYPIQQPREDGKPSCRGCGAAIPKRRRTWCSNACFHLYEPSRVLAACHQRDKGICCQCGRKPRRKGRKSQINYDHIIPFSEGGLTVVENIRTLCSACHKAITKEWHGTRKIVGRKEGSMSLVQQPPSSQAI